MIAYSIIINMKVIVCYGDSNTWGYKPEKVPPEPGFSRFGYNERWPGRLQMHLGADYKIEEEGLSGRTTAFEDPFNPNLNGLKFIDCCLTIKSPLDLLIIALGTNDTKEYFSVSAFHIAMGLEQLILKALSGQYGPNGKEPEILIISPPPIRDSISEKWTGQIFGKGALEKSKAISKEYQKIARKHHCHFLDMALLVECSDIDGVYLDAANHDKFAKAIHKKICEIMEA